MKLQKATIYGFGKWVDYSIDFSNQSFIAIYGENESGKTTIQQFILFMLFGLPPKDRKHFQPKSSGKLGGRLTVLDQEVGQFTIERLGDYRNGAAVCFTPDGKEYPEDWLKERLGGVDRKTFQSIFSFSALDLSMLHEVKDEDLSEMLLGIGLTGSTRIQSVEKKFVQRLGEYFKPYGKNPIINQQLAKLDKLNEELSRLKLEEASYREKKNKTLELESAIHEIHRKIRIEQDKLITLERRLQVLPLVEEYITYQHRLAQLPEDIPFPQEGIERLQSLKEKLLPLRSEMKISETTKTNLLKEKNELESVNKNFPIVEGENILSYYPTYEVNQRDMRTINKQIEKLEEEINTGLSDLNIVLSIEELATLHFPFHLENQWQELKLQKEKLTNEKQSIEEQIHLQQLKQTRIDKEKEDIEISLLSSEEKKAMEEIVDSHKANELMAALHEEIVRKHVNWKKTKEKTSKRTSRLLTVSIIISVIFGVLTVLTDNLLFINLTALAILLGIAQFVLGKKSIQQMDFMLNENTGTNNLSVISEQELIKARRLLQMNEENIRELELLQDKLRDCEIQLNQLHEQQQLLKIKETDLEQKINEQKMTYPFLANVKLIYWSELLHTLRNVLLLNKKLNEQYHEKKHLQEKIDHYHDSIEHFFENNSFDTKLQTIQAKLEYLTSKVEEYHDRQKQIDQTTKLMEEREKHIQELTITIETIEGEVQLLLDKAEARDEEEFYKLSKELVEKQKLIEACEKIAVQVTNFFTQVEWEQLVNQPPMKRVLEIELEETKQAINELENELEQSRHQLAQVKVESQRLESSEAYSEKMHQFEKEKEKLTNLTRNWAVLKIGKELLVETKDNFRDTYLEKVLEKTSYFFEQLTNGYYHSVYPPLHDTPFIVERNDHTRFKVNELSQGTLNQLYVSLRLAISEVMSEKIHLPFIIDDAFVHFDSQRSSTMIQLLKAFSSRHQILFFTCKDEILTDQFDKNVIRLTNTTPLVEN